MIASGNEVRFGRFRFDLERRELSRDEQPLHVGGRALDILHALASAQGDVVSKDELLTKVWPGLVVGENNLLVQVSALRKALQEGAKGQSYLVTVPGRGYRLVGLIRRDHPALPDRPSIAVLPFQNMSDDPGQDYFADGIVDDIITALCHIRWLFVIARNSSFTYKGRAVDVKQVGRELGVRYVLEGGVRKAAQRVRITAQLIDASTGAHLWADHFDGGVENIFDLQDQIAANVVGAVSPELESAEIERAKRKPTESLDAYDYFLRGLASAHRVTRDATEEALTLFSRAIELDPDFAAPCGAAAFCYVVRKLNGWMTPRKKLPKPRGWLGARRKWARMTRWRSPSPDLRSAMWSATSKGRSHWSTGRWCSMQTWRRPGTPAAPCGRFAAESPTWPLSTSSGRCA
jgi:TolB-like protein